MLSASDLESYDIQDFCAEALNNSVEFKDFCTTLVGEPLNIETDAILNDIDKLPMLPYCSIHSGESIDDLTQPEWGSPYEIGLVFGISDTVSDINPNSPFVEENGIKKYSSARTVQKISKQAILTIKDEMARTGINGDYNIQIVTASGTTTNTGEAEDMNYILSLTFNYLNSIMKDC